MKAVPIEPDDLMMLDVDEEDKLRLAAFFEVGYAIAFSLDHRELLDRILAATRKISGADVCSLRLLDDDGQSLTLAASVGLDWHSPPVRLGESVIGRAVLEKKAVSVPDIENSLFAKPDFAKSQGLVSMLSVPLLVKDRAIGGLTIYHSRRRDYDAGDIKLLRAIASTAAVSIENFQLFRDSVNTLVSLARAIEARDRYTQGHSERVTAYAAALAEHCGLSDEDVLLIKKLGLLHDIGKVGIVDGLLSKPGALTDEERTMMQRHPEIGENIIRPVKLLQPGMHLVRNHHERIDGNGYPDGIGGSDIPVSVRIVSIADSYDAMTSNRAYRSALTNRQALDELKKCSGTQFDAALVPEFIEVVRRQEF